MKRHLLLVDADAQSRRILEVSLRKAGHAVTGVGDAGAALERMGAALPDLVLADTQLPGTNGFDLVAAIRQRPAWSGVPVMFLSSDLSPESRLRGLQQGVEEYLTKPTYLHEVVARVNLVLERRERDALEGRTTSAVPRASGSLHDLGLADAMQAMANGRRSGVVHVNGGGERGALYFRDGALVDVEVGALRREPALERALSWSEGTFEVEFREVRRDDAIRAPVRTVLAESLRRIDDWSRLAETLPPLDHVLEVDATRLGARLDDVPDEANATLRFFDGRRTIQQAIDAAGDDDIGRLRMIAQLWSGGFLFDRTGGRGAEVPRKERTTADFDAPPTKQKKRTTADFEAPVTERTKRTTLDYDKPAPRAANPDPDEAVTTPGTLDAGTPLAPTSPGEAAAPTPAGVDSTGNGGDADTEEEGVAGDEASPGSGLTRMRKRRRRWKRLSIEGAIPESLREPAATPASTTARPAPLPAPPAPPPAATAPATPPATAARPATATQLAPATQPAPPTQPAPGAQTSSAMQPAPGAQASSDAQPAALAPSAIAPDAPAKSDAPRPSATLLDVAQPRLSGPPPAVRSPFSLVPPAADLEARMNAGRARRSVVPEPPTTPTPPPTPAAPPAPTAPQGAVGTVKTPTHVVAGPAPALMRYDPGAITAPTHAMAARGSAMIHDARTPRGAGAATTGTEDLGRTRIVGSVTTQPSLAPPPAAPVPVAPAAITAPAMNQPAIRRDDEPPKAAAPAHVDAKPAPPATAAGAPSANARGGTAVRAEADAARPATPHVTGVHPLPASTGERQSAWDIPQDEEPVTVPPPPPSQQVLVWGAIIGAALVGAALVARLVSSDVTGVPAPRTSSAGSESATTTPSEAIDAPPPVPVDVAPAPPAPPAPTPPPPASTAPTAAGLAAPPATPQGATDPNAAAPATPTATAQGEVAVVAPVAPDAAEPAPAPAEPAAAPTAVDATTQTERDALVARARKLEAKGKPVQALALYEDAVRLDPNASSLLSHLALGYLNAGRYKDALDRAGRAVSADPTNSEGWIVLGAARDARNDRKGAREAYRQCADIGTGAYVLECRRMLR